MKADYDFSHYCDDPKNKFFVFYNVKDKITYKFEVPYETMYLFDSAQINEKIYFTGGGMPKMKSNNEVFFNTAVCVTIYTESMDNKNTKLKPMNVARANHTLIAVGEKLLYAIGGCNETAELSSCEEYQIESGEWKDCPSLNERKMWVSVSTFNGQHLYAFGGSSNLKPKETNTIEYLDINDKKAKQWTKITLTAGGEICPRCFFIGALQVDANNIMLFGGLLDNHTLDTTYYFNPTTKTLTTGDKLLKKDAFYRSKPGFNGSQIGIVGNTDGDMHIYDKATKKWAMMARATWNADIGVNLKSDTY